MLIRSCGIGTAMDGSNLFNGDNFNKVVNNIVWCSDNMLSLKFWTSSEYNVKSDLNRLHIFPRCRLEKEVVVAFFQCLNQPFNYFIGVIFPIFFIIISLLSLRIFKYLATLGAEFSRNSYHMVDIEVIW